MTGLYSPINKLMEQVTRPKGTGAEYMAELSKKPGYKPAEAEDRDLQALMALPQMQRAEFMEKLKAQANKYPLKMRELGAGQTHHETYTLPGGENYREILLHTPPPGGNTLTPERLGFEGVRHHFGGLPNILASIRVKDRLIPDTEGPHKVKVMDRNGFTTVKHKTRADAERFADIKQQGGYRTEISPMNHKKVLHLEEIQSDWHQQGREGGYLPKDFEKQVKEIRNWRNGLRKESTFSMDKYEYAEHQKALEEAEAELEKLENLKYESVPYGPHAKDWHELALKAMIQHAAENGYDQIAVTPGAEQAKRFGLSKQVGAVSYNPETQHFQAFKPNRETITNEKGATPERVKALIGKEAAAKLLQAPQTMGHHYLEGEDLDIGGEGMKGFYDKMVPTFLNKFGKKHGVQVQPGAITVPEGIESGWATKVKPAYEAPVHTFDITPGMREDVLKNGIPRYDTGGSVDRAAISHKDVTKRIPALTQAAQQLGDGVTREQYEELVNQHKPVTAYSSVPRPASQEEILAALTKTNREAPDKPHKTSYYGVPSKTLKEGDPVGLRLDIPSYQDANTWVVTVHGPQSGKKVYGGAGTRIGYEPVAAATDVHFQVHPGGAKKIAQGAQKSTLATMEGKWKPIDPEQAHANAQGYMDDPDWIQVGMDPTRHSYFYDRATMQPVTHAHEVLHIGPLVFARKPTYGKKEDFHFKEGGNVSRETTKPVGNAVVKEKVTISPNMDVMQYELLTKKVK